MRLRSRLEAALCLLILAGYLLAGALFAVYTPAWQTPDEPAHYNYVRHVAENGCCPRIEPGDWRSDTLHELTSARFAPHTLELLDSLQYENHQPPLYYLLAALVYKLGDGSLLALRLFSVLLGAATVCLAYAIGKAALPGRAQIALGAMALVAFLPQHLAMMSAVNNDALAEVIVALALLCLTRCLKGLAAPMWLLGLIAGLALLCKVTIYFLIPLCLLAIWLAWKGQDKPASALARQIAVFLLVALLIGGGWWLRNISVYGYPDFLGLAAHDAVVADQPRTADYVATHGWLNYARQFFTVTFQSFWGQFGWMALPLDSVLGGWVYRGFALLTLAGLSGAMLAARACRPPDARARTEARQIGFVYGAAIAFALLAYFYYNLEFLQWQGRYLFPALIPIALTLSIGIDFWRARVFSRWQRSRWLTPMLLTCLCALDVYLLLRVIVPGLTP